MEFKGEMEFKGMGADTTHITSHHIKAKCDTASERVHDDRKFEGCLWHNCVCCCMRLDCESLTCVGFIPLFVIHVWHPRFPLNEIKKYLACLMVGC